MSRPKSMDIKIDAKIIPTSVTINMGDPIIQARYIIKVKDHKVDDGSITIFEPSKQLIDLLHKEITDGIKG